MIRASELIKYVQPFSCDVLLIEILLFLQIYHRYHNIGVFSVCKKSSIFKKQVLIQNSLWFKTRQKQESLIFETLEGHREGSSTSLSIVFCFAASPVLLSKDHTSHLVTFALSMSKHNMNIHDFTSAATFPSLSLNTQEPNPLFCKEVYMCSGPLKKRGCFYFGQFE